MTYEQNLADKHLVVGSIEVLKDTTSSTTKQLKRSVEAVKKQTMQMFRQNSIYWDKLSDDGIITPLEKNMLKREFENIQKSYTAIYTQADTLGYLSTEVVQDYLDTYETLRAYLFDTLRLFDEMSIETPIPDRSVFNQKFSNYYFDESFVLIAINLKIVEAIDFRVLSNLQEEGEENEIALFQGGIYMYYNGEWKSVSSGDYKGALTSIPAVQEKAFFIASDDFNSTESLYVNGEELYVNGEPLAVTRKIDKGYIYYCADGDYIRDRDRTGYRYVAAFADVINITGELPELFQVSISNLQSQIDDLSDSISNVSGGLTQEIEDRQGQYTILSGDIVEINGDISGIISRLNTAEGDISGIEGDISDIESDLSGKIDHLPVYYGARSTNPTNPKEGDWYVYNGTSTSSRLKNKVYVYRSGTWTYLAANLTENRSYYMMALKDILGGTEIADDEFDVLFANSFFADSATMDSLALREIKLRQNGVIISDATSYSQETYGLKIDANGNIDANENVHIGGKVAIGAPLTGNSDFDDYDVVIGTGSSGGRVKVKGHIEATSGTFSGSLVAGNVNLTNCTIKTTNYNLTTGIRLSGSGLNLFGSAELNVQGGGSLSKIRVKNSRFINQPLYPFTWHTFSSVSEFVTFFVEYFNDILDALSTSTTESFRAFVKCKILYNTTSAGHIVGVSVIGDVMRCTRGMNHVVVEDAELNAYPFYSTDSLSNFSAYCIW